MNKVIEGRVVQLLLEYLATRPYREVYQVMPVLHNLPDAPDSDAHTLREPPE